VAVCRKRFHLGCWRRWHHHRNGSVSEFQPLGGIWLTVRTDCNGRKFCLSGNSGRLAHSEIQKVDYCETKLHKGLKYIDTHMQPNATEPEPGAPPKQSRLARYAIWSGAATVGVPVLWAVLTSALGGNAGLTVGWFGVLPIILFVPLGIIATLALTIAAAVESNKQKETTKASSLSTTNRNDRNA
jgi:hypothetical protein